MYMVECKKRLTCSQEFAKCFWAFVKCFWVFTRGSCGLHREFVHVWFLAKIHRLCMNIHYPLEATSIQNKYIQFVRRHGTVWPTSRKWFANQLTKIWKFMWRRGWGSHESVLWKGPWALCKGLQALQRLFTEDSLWVHNLFFACYRIHTMYSRLHDTNHCETLLKCMVNWVSRGLFSSLCSLAQ